MVQPCWFRRSLLSLGVLAASGRGVAAECANFLLGSPANLPDPRPIFHTSVAVRQFLAEDARQVTQLRFAHVEPRTGIGPAAARAARICAAFGGAGAAVTGSDHPAADSRCGAQQLSGSGAGGMSTIITGVKAHDDALANAERTRQAAAVAGASQATLKGD